MKSMLLKFVLGCLVAGLAYFSFKLAGTRAYRADECWQVYKAKASGNMADKSSNNTSTPFQFLLSRVVKNVTHSADAFVFARLAMFLFFLLNWLLLASATGQKMFSTGWFFALFAVITTASFWNYGFEVRNENLLLSLILLMWSTVRFGELKLFAFTWIGFLSSVSQAVSQVGFAYSAMLFVMALFLCGKKSHGLKSRFFLAWLAGAAVSFLLLQQLGISPLWRASDGFSHAAFTTTGFQSSLLPVVGAMIQSPLLVALGVSALIAEAIALFQNHKFRIDRNWCLPEACLFIGVAVISLLSRRSVGHDIVLLFPVIFLLAFRYLSLVSVEIRRFPSLFPIVVCVCIFGHILPFSLAVWTEFLSPNYRQENLMRAAESLTDPNKDGVYDGVGLVATRKGNPDEGFLFQSTLRRLARTRTGLLNDLFSTNPPSVLLRNNFTDQLPQSDQRFINERYVAIADDFHVLGKSLPSGGGVFQIYHPGRYRIAALEGSDIQGTYPADLVSRFQPPQDGKIEGLLDGHAVTNSCVELSIGLHRIECSSTCQPTVVWVGPHLNRVGRQSDSDRKRLFYN